MISYCETFAISNDFFAMHCLLYLTSRSVFNLTSSQYLSGAMVLSTNLTAGYINRMIAYYYYFGGPSSGQCYYFSGRQYRMLARLSGRRPTMGIGSPLPYATILMTSPNTKIEKTSVISLGKCFSRCIFFI